MDLNLRPLSYDEFCQMELLHVVTSNNSTDNNNLTTNTTIPVDNNISNGTGGGNTCATTAAAAAAAALLPIMVIPTSMLNSGGSNSVSTNSIVPENYYAAYMPQAAFLLTPTPQITTSMSSSTSSAAAAAVAASTTTTTTTLNTATITNPLVATSCYQQQQQQHATINLSKLLESSTLPRRPTNTGSFVANINSINNNQQQHVNNHVNVATNMDESDFEGSECGASVSSASTCIPHFRFNACGMMLQPVQTQHHHHHHSQQQQQQQQQHHANSTDDAPNNLIGCGPFSHVMGSFGALQTSRLMGSLVGVAGSAGLSGTLGRNRRTCNMQQGGNTGTQKRVSFKADLVPAEQIVNYGGGYCMDWSNSGLRPGIMQSASMAGAQMPAVSTANSYQNVGMHFDTFMDYQVRSKTTTSKKKKQKQ